MEISCYKVLQNPSSQVRPRIGLSCCKIANHVYIYERRGWAAALKRDFMPDCCFMNHWSLSLWLVMVNLCFISWLVLSSYCVVPCLFWVFLYCRFGEFSFLDTLTKMII